MKITREKKKQDKHRNVQCRLAESVIKELDKVSNDNGVSRQRLMEIIIETALADKNFEIKF